MAKSLASSIPGTELSALDKIQLPAVFTSKPPDLISRFNVPYLVFVHPQAKEQWMNIARKIHNLEEGDPILIMNEHEFFRPKPLKISLLNAKQYFAVVDPTGDELSAHRGEGPGRVERIWTALIVYEENRIIPCTCLFKTTKCAAIHTIKNAMSESTDADWVNRGPEFAAAAKVCASPQLHFARVIATITLVSKVGKRSGLVYKMTKAFIEPSGPKEWSLLQTVGTPEVLESLKNVALAFQSKAKDEELKD